MGRETNAAIRRTLDLMNQWYSKELDPEVKTAFTKEFTKMQADHSAVNRERERLQKVLEKRDFLLDKKESLLEKGKSLMFEEERELEYTQFVVKRYKVNRVDIV